eukprot:223170-Chlamydomonas_euryale.AAC.1
MAEVGEGGGQERGRQLPAGGGYEAGVEETGDQGGGGHVCHASVEPLLHLNALKGTTTFPQLLTGPVQQTHVHLLGQTMLVRREGQGDISDTHPWMAQGVGRGSKRDDCRIKLLTAHAAR